MVWPSCWPRVAMVVTGAVVISVDMRCPVYAVACFCRCLSLLWLLPLLFWFVIPSAASEPAVSRFLPMSAQMPYRKATPFTVPLCFSGDTTEEREKAGSLAALGMTNQKGKKQKQKLLLRHYPKPLPRRPRLYLNLLHILAKLMRNLKNPHRGL